MPTLHEQIVEESRRNEITRRPVSGFSLKTSLMGTSSIITKIVEKGSDLEEKINRENIGQQFGVELPIIYGKSMINAKLLNSEEIRSDLDPNRILKKIRLSAGEGADNEGFGDTLEEIAENVFVNGVPVKDPKSGDWNFADIAIKWGIDQILGNTTPLMDVGDSNPLTGAPLDILNGFEKIFGRKYKPAKNTNPLGNPITPDNTGENWIPYFDGDIGEWSTRHINEVLKQANPYQPWSSC